MDHLSKEAQKVFDIIKKHEPIRSSEIAQMLRVSNKTLHKHLSVLLEEGVVGKSGKTPRVFYFVSKGKKNNLPIDNFNDFIIEQNYLYLSPSGEMIRGFNGFMTWCQKNNFEINKEKDLFLKEIKSKQRYQKDGLISAKKMILSGKNDAVHLDDIFFSDFYTMSHFGKTKLGQLIYLGKTSQNKELIAEAVNLVRPGIMNIIKKFSIELIAFVPPTIDRKVQFIDFFKKQLKLNLKEIKTMKTSSEIKIPQKTLRKLEDRIINARTSIAVNPNQKINSNVLIIDDATGSGATMNETAHKIRNISKNKIKIIAYSVVGSYKSFDVISEV